MQAVTGNGVGRLTTILVITVKQETEALKALTDPNFEFSRSLSRFRRWYVLPWLPPSIPMISGETKGMKESSIKVMWDMLVFWSKMSMPVLFLTVLLHHPAVCQLKQHKGFWRECLNKILHNVLIASSNYTGICNKEYFTVCEVLSEHCVINRNRNYLYYSYRAVIWQLTFFCCSEWNSPKSHSRIFNEFFLGNIANGPRNRRWNFSDLMNSGGTLVFQKTKA